MKLAKIISLITLFFLLVPYLSFAQIPPPESAPFPEIPTSLFGCLPNEPLRTCLLKLTGVVLRVILVVALAFAAIFIAWAGLLYIGVLGFKEERQKEAQSRIIYAAVGLVVAFLAWVLAFILSRTLGGGVQF
jgi:hypothetical protein